MAIVSLPQTNSKLTTIFMNLYSYSFVYLFKSILKVPSPRPVLGVDEQTYNQFIPVMISATSEKYREI